MRGHVLDAAAPRALLRATEHERREPQTAPHEERAGALRAAELVRGDRAEVGAEAEKSTGACPAAAHASTWTMTSRSRACSTTSADRLERADLVVGELHRDQRGVGPDRVEHLAGIEPAGAIDADRGDVRARRARHTFRAPPSARPRW